MEKNYYSILGVSQQATYKEIKKAYIKQALIYHPDKNKDNLAVSKFQEIKEIYEILKNPLSRREYDLYLNKDQKNKEKYKDAKRGPSPGGTNPNFDEYEPVVSSHAGNVSSGEEIIRNIFLYSDEYKTGKYLDLNIMVADICAVCYGKRAGCPSCNGSGQILKIKKFNIHIPSYTKPGTFLKLQGVGHKSPFVNGQGDIFIHVSWPKNKEEWYIEGDNVYTNIEISKTKKNKKIKVKNFDGVELLVNIPVEACSEQSLRIKNKGWFIDSQNRGDLIITVYFKEDNTPIIEKTFKKIISFISKD